MALMDDADLRARTKQTSQKLFHTLKGGSGFEMWKKFDKGLARELSLFFTGVLYSREVRAHIHAALNVGATRQEVAEVIFQMVTYGGMPVVVDALEVYGQVLAERGEPFPAEEPSR